MGWQLARGLPRKNYRRILDLGCGIGKSTLPYCDLYPNAEVVGLDYAAPMLKYGHKLAESRGKKVRFVQRHAECAGFPDESFDLAVAIWLFHELPRKARDQVVREAHRLLRPGGLFAIMESPPFKNLNESYSKLSAFLLDSTGRRMNDLGYLNSSRKIAWRCSGAADSPMPRFGAAQRAHRLGHRRQLFLRRLSLVDDPCRENLTQPPLRLHALEGDLNMASLEERYRAICHRLWGDDEGERIHQWIRASRPASFHEQMIRVMVPIWEMDRVDLRTKILCCIATFTLWTSPRWSSSSKWRSSMASPGRRSRKSCC